MTTTCDIWTTLKTLYGCVDVAAQFDLRAHISNVKLEDFTGLDKYIGEFKIAQSRFITMGASGKGHLALAVFRCFSCPGASRTIF